MPQLGSAVKRGRGVSDVFFQSVGLCPGSLSKSRSTSREPQINTAFQSTNFRSVLHNLNKQPALPSAQLPPIAGSELAPVKRQKVTSTAI